MDAHPLSEVTRVLLVLAGSIALGGACQIRFTGTKFILAAMAVGAYTMVVADVLLWW